MSTCSHAWQSATTDLPHSPSPKTSLLTPRFPAHYPTLLTSMSASCCSRVSSPCCCAGWKRPAAAAAARAPAPAWLLVRYVVAMSHEGPWPFVARFTLSGDTAWPAAGRLSTSCRRNSSRG